MVKVFGLDGKIETTIRPLVSVRVLRGFLKRREDSESQAQFSVPDPARRPDEVQAATAPKPLPFTTMIAPPVSGTFVARAIEAAVRTLVDQASDSVRPERPKATKAAATVARTPTVAPALDAGEDRQTAAESDTHDIAEALVRPYLRLCELGIVAKPEAESETATPPVVGPLAHVPGTRDSTAGLELKAADAEDAKRDTDVIANTNDIAGDAAPGDATLARRVVPASHWDEGDAVARMRAIGDRSVVPSGPETEDMKTDTETVPVLGVLAVSMRGTFEA